jgi:hypothetical protein
MAEDAEEIPGRPVELKTRGGSLSSEGPNAAAQAEKSTPIKLLSSININNKIFLVRVQQGAQIEIFPPIKY